MNRATFFLYIKKERESVNTFFESRLSVLVTGNLKTGWYHSFMTLNGI